MLATQSNNVEANPLVSVIMPVFNTPFQHLERAIDSVASQTYQNIELIIVIDGCDKAFSDEVKVLASKVEWTTVAWKEHGGVSAARNHGMKLAAGEFIAFVDSDDEMIDICISHAVRFAIENNLDLVCGGVEYLFVDAKRRSHLELGDEGPVWVLEGDLLPCLSDFFMAYERIRRLPKIRRLPRGPVAKLYSRQLIAELEFDTSFSVREDGIFNAAAVERAARVGLVDEIWYRYYRNSYSASGNLRLGEPFRAHIRALSGYFGISDSKDNDIYAQICTLFFEAATNETRRKTKGRFRHIVEALNDPPCSEAFRKVQIDGFDVTRWRRVNYWLCKRKWALPVYLYYVRKTANQKAHGQILREVNPGA